MAEQTLYRPSTVALPELIRQSVATGYLHAVYAASLAEFGAARELPRSGGWLLERGIPGCESRDAMGCYPLFACQHWEGLHADLDELAGNLVTVVLVTDPFAPVDKAYLDYCFDFVKPFKCHYVADLTTPLESFVDRHHRYYARKSCREIEVEVCDTPSRYAQEWIGLYDYLVQTHNIRGIRAFSPECFHRQLSIPGMVLVVARQRGQIVGGHLVAIHGNVAYSHLAACSAPGYQVRAAYGIYWTTLDYLAAHGVSYFDLGGAAGLADTPTDGLSLFKHGWSNATRIVYLCGRVFDPSAYARICLRTGRADTQYFPAYRAGEFA